MAPRHVVFGEVEERAIDMLEDWRLGHHPAQPEIPQTLGEALILAGQKTLALERQEQVTLVVARRSAEPMIELKAKDSIVEHQGTRLALIGSDRSSE